jgi:hypothetical protein
LCFSAQGKQLHIPMEYLAEHESEFLMTKPYTTATILLLLWSCQIEKQSLYLFVEYIKAKGTPCCVGHPVHMHINVVHRLYDGTAPPRSNLPTRWRQ